ncbi:MAG TPA: class I SAM-dependent methyltransferase [Acetobacteraceae bacterium]|nr:class I SAM-dependent methyltransferase [Acetobacteraceae bacterium]
MTEAIYQRPDDYDLEHEGRDEDIDALVRLIQARRPKRVLELGAGSGRLAIPLARVGAREAFDVVGLEPAEEMRRAAAEKLEQEAEEVRNRVALEAGDMRSWRAATPFEVIVCADSSVSHLLTLEDQLATWRTAFANLCPEGIFIVDVVMPQLFAYADSMQTPPRSVVEIDLDAVHPETGTRLIRYKTTLYEPHEQRARIRFLYDKFTAGSTEQPARSLSDFESHVYFPRELQLLYLCTGFVVDAVFGDYRLRPLRATSRQMIAVGRRPAK